MSKINIEEAKKRIVKATQQTVYSSSRKKSKSFGASNDDIDKIEYIKSYGNNDELYLFEKETEDDCPNEIILTSSDSDLKPILAQFDYNILDFENNEELQNEELKFLLDSYSEDVKWYQEEGYKYNPIIIEEDEIVYGASDRQSISPYLWLSGPGTDADHLNERIEWSQGGTGNANVWWNEITAASAPKVVVEGITDHGTYPFIEHTVSPYNTYKSNHVCGCNTTAIGQIMYYWYRKTNGKYNYGCLVDLPSYKCNTDNITTVHGLPKIDKFRYDLMVPRYYKLKPKYDSNGNYTGYSNTGFATLTTEQKTQPATLLKYIGCAIKSSYGIALNDSGKVVRKGTGAAPQQYYNQLNKFFKLGSNIRFITTKGTFIYSSFKKYQKSLSETENELYLSLKNYGPIIASGWSPDASGAHTFVCDGYDANTGLFHFNLGWGGQANGYFSLSPFKSTSDMYNNPTYDAIRSKFDYSGCMAFIIDIKPEISENNSGGNNNNNNDNSGNNPNPSPNPTPNPTNIVIKDKTFNDAIEIATKIANKVTTTKTDVDQSTKTDAIDLKLVIDYLRKTYSLG